MGYGNDDRPLYWPHLKDAASTFIKGKNPIYSAALTDRYFFLGEGNSPATTTLHLHLKDAVS